MTHYSYEEWLKYVKNDLSEDIRVVYEDHLYSCDQCLELFLQAVSEEENCLSAIWEEEKFTNAIMKKVAEVEIPELQTTKTIKNEKKRFLHSTVFHYILAAAMTILFMVTGVFQTLTQYAGDVQSPSFQKEERSMTESVVDKTFAWIDSLEEQSLKEGNK